MAGDFRNIFFFASYDAILAGRILQGSLVRPWSGNADACLWSEG